MAKRDYKTSVASCYKKRAFDSKKEALEEMAWLKTQKNYKKVNRVYRCNNCEKYHITSKK